jgi:hypothetical protein
MMEIAPKNSPITLRIWAGVSVELAFPGLTGSAQEILTNTVLPDTVSARAEAMVS